MEELTTNVALGFIFVFILLGMIGSELTRIRKALEKIVDTHS